MQPRIYVLRSNEGIERFCSSKRRTNIFRMARHLRDGWIDQELHRGRIHRKQSLGMDRRPRSCERRIVAVHFLFGLTRLNLPVHPNTANPSSANDTRRVRTGRGCRFAGIQDMESNECYWSPAVRSGVMALFINSRGKPSPFSC